MKLRHHLIVKETTCIQPLIRDGKVEMCGEACRPDGPHGWLCPQHEAWVHRPQRAEGERTA